jgi:hypothetical protein
MPLEEGGRSRGRQGGQSRGLRGWAATRTRLQEASSVSQTVQVGSAEPWYATERPSRGSR